MATQTRLRQLVANVGDHSTQQALLAIVVALEGTAGVPVQTMAAATVKVTTTAEPPGKKSKAAAPEA